MEQKNKFEADFLNKSLDYVDVRETMSYFGLKNKYCLGKIFNQWISKIEEFDDNENLLISSFDFGNQMKIGRLKFDHFPIPKEYFYFILNKKKDIVLASGENKIGNYTRIKHLVGHTDDIICLCVVGDDYLLSGSKDATIKYWKISTLECIRTFVGHRGFVCSLMLLSTATKFVSGSDDETLKLWILETGECLKTFIGHKNFINDIQETRNGEIVSFDVNGMLKFWNIETGCCMLSLSSEANDIWSCFRILQSGKLVTGSRAGKIQIWSSEQIFFVYHENTLQTKKGCIILLINRLEPMPQETD
ncbi:WD40 repeat-containing [Brachionus plicatilis]|uniref:WD40 repeat-containing n=1 Tax=Brachionus plicatilis TaxID=10195 RepID=A0A3M7SX19_BRAPC|nr:WD40 repeat-containing [Brachionus plicatilis]